MSRVLTPEEGLARQMALDEEAYLDQLAAYAEIYDIPDAPPDDESMARIALEGLYCDLLAQARARGHKPNWIWHEFHRQAGEYPPQSWIAEAESALESDDAWAAAIQDRERNPRGSRRQRERASAVTARSGDRRVVHIEASMAPVYDDALAALRTVDDIYERGVLVHVSEVTEAEAEKLRRSGTPVHAGVPTIRDTSHASLTLRLARAADWTRTNEKGNLVETRPDTAVVAALRDEGAWPGVRHLVGVRETPFLRPDGTLCQTRGYDAQSGLLYIPNADYPTIDEEPTRAKAMAALDRLIDLFREFPYAAPAHIALPVSNILTILGRAAIAGPVPAHLYDASSRGSGKTLQAHVVSVVCTGRTASMKDYPITRSFGGAPPTTDEEEMRKMLDGYALLGAPLIALDNVDQVPFGGSVLEMALTTRDDRDARVLGKSEIRRVPWFQVIVATGNNLSVVANTQRRVLRCRLETIDAHPEDLTGFRYRLPDDAQTMRPSLVVAGLTVLLAWQAAMRRGACSELPSWDPFDRWVKVVAAAITYAGGPNVLECRVREEIEVDKTTAAMTKFLVALPSRCSESEVGAARIVEAAQGDPEFAQILTDLVGKDELPTAAALGARLSSAQLSGTSGVPHRRTGRAIAIDGAETRRLVGSRDRGTWRWCVERRGGDGWQRI